MSRKAKLGFCSFTIRARKVATNAIPTIWMISIADAPLSLIQEDRFYLLEQIIDYRSHHEQDVDEPE